MVNRAGAVSLSENRPPPACAGEFHNPEWNIGEGGRLLVSHPGGAPVLAGALAEALDQAVDEVILAAMSLYQTDEIPLLGPALGRCLARGVKVRAIVRPEQFKRGVYPDPSTLELLESGMNLFGVTGLHAKGLLIDGRWCGLHSANFNPYSLDPRCETANWEFGIVGPADHPILSEWASFIQNLADHPTHRFRSN